MCAPALLPGNTPAGTVGLVGPRPVPHSVMTSPGLAGPVVCPEKVPFLAAIVKSLCVATGWLFGHGQNAGATVSTVVVKAALVPVERVRVAPRAVREVLRREAVLREAPAAQGIREVLHR